MSKATVLIMAAGTGGHVFPALACAREFQARGYQVHWLGTPTGIENDLVTEDIPLHAIQMSGMRGKGIARVLQMPLQLLRAISQARAVIKQLRPVCVVGFGGYVTVPGGLAAKLSKVPLIIHEQNAIAGTANKTLAPFAQVVCEGFAGAFAGRDKVVATGNPVRASLFSTSSVSQSDNGKINLLVLGGSLGAEPLNKLLPQAIGLLANPEHINVRHQAGKQHAEITAQRYLEQGLQADVQPFISDMAAAYAWADLVICRAGALTVSELTAVGVAAILVPLPHAIDDHQTQNARFLAEQGAAKLLVQHATTAELLAAELTEVLMNKDHLIKMGEKARHLAKANATQDVVNLCLEVAHG